MSIKKADKIRKKAEIGDLVEISTEKEKLKGILLESYDSSIVLIKLSSGYNEGVLKKDILNIEVIKKFEKSNEIEREEKKELKKSLPQIGIVITGGTISSHLDPSTGAVKWLMQPSQLFKIAPRLKEIVNISKIERPFMIASENMSALHWKEIAEKTAELLNKKENFGVIITHGTDTLHYTSAALSFMLRNINKPVILTFAQRSTDRGSTDTALNLTCAAYAAISDIAEVMLVGHGTLSDEFCYAIRGTKVRKMHTSRRDTFRPINEMPFAKVYGDGKFEILNKNFNKRNNGNVSVDAVFEEKIALIKFFPSMKAEQIEFFVKNDYKGIVVEATGLGHVATEEAENNLLPVIKKAIDRGIIVCFVPQTIYGRLDPYVYSPGRKLLETGIIFCKDMLPETAYIKLGWLLGHKLKRDEIKKLMEKNLYGEINERISEKDFLF